jgi:hypothetical protein
MHYVSKAGRFRSPPIAKQIWKDPATATAIRPAVFLHKSAPTIASPIAISSLQDPVSTID